MGIVSPHDFYVYTLYRNGIPFYVGKGSNGRIDAHEMCARNRDKCPHQTCRVIRKIWRTGETLTKSKVCEEVSEKTAFKKEHDLSLKCMSLVARGKNHSHKGWKRFDC